MESSNSNSKERELQLTQRLAKQRHSICMTWFEQLETHLHDLYLLNSPYAVDAFKPAFRSFFGEEHQTFKLKMFHNLDQLRLQLERENLHGVNAKTCLQALRTQFKEFVASKGVNATNLLNQGWQQDFEDFTRCEPSAYRRELLENLDTLEAVIHRVVNTYGVLRMKENEVNALKENGSQLHDEILHEHQIKSSVKMQSQDIQINPVQAMDDSLIVSKSSLIEPENNNAFSKSEIETQIQRQEENVDMREAVYAGLVVIESSRTKPDKKDTSSSSGNYTTQVVDADIGPLNDEEPFAEVQLTTLHNILANEQHHTEQSEPNYDTHMLETIDSNTTPTSTNMCHIGGEIDQDALLNAELLKTKDMSVKNVDLKAQIQEKVFANAALNNELRKLKGNIVDSKFTKASILGKPPLQPSRNHLVVRQPNAFTSERPRISRPRTLHSCAHLNYVKHLKESVETVREIVEEARVVKPLDSSLNYACQYTKLSQELLECVIGTCPKSFNERDNKAPSTPVTRKKQVTFSDAPGTSSSNTQKHEVHQKVQQTNVHVIHSTGVNTSTEASGSKPRGNTKKNRIPPAKTENKKKVEVHPRTNKSVWTKVNRVDSSISSKRVVINSNSESVCKTCNKCLNSANHEMCVVNILSSVNATPTVKIVLNKGKQIWKPKGKLSDNSLNKTKQIWKPKGKLSDNSLNKTKQVWKATGKLFANVGYQWRSTGKKVALGKLNCGYQWRPTGKKFALGELCPLTKLSVQCSIITANQQDPNTNWGSEVSNPPNSTVFKCRCSGPEPIMMFGQNSSSLVLHQMMSAQISSGLAPQCLKMFDHSSSSLGLHCQKTFKQISSNLVSQMSQRRLLASLQAPFLKEKKDVRFSALYLHQKRNLLVLDHSHQQIRKGNLLLDLQKLQKNPIFRSSVDIHQNTNYVRAVNVASIYIQLFWNTLTHDAKTGRSLLHDNIVPKPDLALELGKSISLTEAKEEAVAREVHATHARIVSESEPEPTQRRQFEAADIMKALKESMKISKRQPGTEGLNEGTGNILGVPDESTVISRASSEGTGSKPGVLDEEKLILE
ncbi:hypothetical protein Tco_0752166 [Tanacetum coccineum]|uniref:Retrotransposon gag domain-containing protein n=1 Tax=Tanacetum coccineum TaxID=301880 RepID=A0ABQ4Z729_9ASTR